MTRLIDADALMPMMKYATTDSEIGVFPIKIGFNAIAKVIENAPTVDAEPVVRCKDCVFWEHAFDDWGKCYGIMAGLGTYDGGFCAWAERKEE